MRRRMQTDGMLGNRLGFGIVGMAKYVWRTEGLLQGCHNELDQGGGDDDDDDDDDDDCCFGLFTLMFRVQSR